MSKPFNMADYRSQFPTEPLEGPAREIYQYFLMARPGPKSCAFAIKEALEKLYPTAGPPDGPQIVPPPEIMTDVGREEIHTPGPAGQIRSLLYKPLKASGARPVVVYIHGGGWSLGTPDEGDFLSRKLCYVSNCIVLSVDYRLAPEHPYPSGLDDCVSVYQYVRKNAATFGGNPERVAVGGDSCGGNLAPALTLRMRDEGGRVPDANLLLCPATDFRFEKFDSMWKKGMRSIVYDTAFIGAVRGGYVPPPLWDHPYVSPAKGDLKNFPPTLIIAGTADPLLDDNRAFFQKLRAAGNQDVELREYQDMPHAFYYFLGFTKEGDEAYLAMGGFLKRVLR